MICSGTGAAGRAGGCEGRVRTGGFIDGTSLLGSRKDTHSDFPPYLSVTFAGQRVAPGQGRVVIVIRHRDQRKLRCAATIAMAIRIDRPLWG
jgi:hypothetical protein